MINEDGNIWATSWLLEHRINTKFTGTEGFHCVSKVNSIKYSYWLIFIHLSNFNISVDNINTIDLTRV